MQPRPLPTAVRTLGDIRADIDRIDEALLALVADRLALAEEVKMLKARARLFRPDREAELFARVTAGPVPAPVGRAIWTQLIAGMLAAEGVSEILFTDEALRIPALLRFGQVLPLRHDPDALTHACRYDAIVVALPDQPAPSGCVVLAPVHDETGAVVGQVIGAEGDK